MCSRSRFGEDKSHLSPARSRGGESNPIGHTQDVDFVEARLHYLTWALTRRLESERERFSDAPGLALERKRAIFLRPNLGMESNPTGHTQDFDFVGARLHYMAWALTRHLIALSYVFT